MATIIKEAIIDAPPEDAWAALRDFGYPDCPDLQDPNGLGNPVLRPYPYCPEQAPFAPRPTATTSATDLPPLPGPAATGGPSAPAPTADPATTAGDRRANDSELVPYWIYPIEDGAVKVVFKP